jgi:hypothetical protein
MGVRLVLFFFSHSFGAFDTTFVVTCKTATLTVDCSVQIMNESLFNFYFSITRYFNVVLLFYCCDVLSWVGLVMSVRFFNHFSC